MTTEEIRKTQTNQITVVCMIGNLILTAFKLLAGVVGHSSAMIADAVHSLSDMLTDIVLLVGVHFGAKPEDDEHPYGHGRIETFATLVIAVILLLVACGICWEGLKAILKVYHGGQLPKPGSIALVMAFVSVIVKEIMYRYTVKVGKQIDSMAVISNAWHHRSDAFSSLATLFGIGGAIVLGDKWTILDPLTAMFVSLFIFGIGYKIARLAVEELLDGALPSQEIEKIKQICLSVPGVRTPHDIKTRKVGYRVSIVLHVDIDKNTSFEHVHQITNEIEDKLQEVYGKNTFLSVHPEPFDL